MDLKFRLHYWPILTAVWFVLTFLTSYLIAIFNNHVSEVFPYISDTGSTPPESCIFGQMLNIGAALMLITIYIRYKTLELILQRGDPKQFKWWNHWSNLFGTCSCLGISIVANFQETSERTVHFVGAFLAFGVGAVYCIIQSFLTWLSYSSKFLKCIRIFVSFWLLPFYVITTVFSLLAFDKFDGKDVFKWSDKDAGYDLHLAATFSEWIMAILMAVYVATYYVEFRLVKFQEISFTLDE